MENPRIPAPVEGCSSCQGTGGAYSCPIHSPNIYVRTESKPFCYLSLQCPWCGKDIVLEGIKQELFISQNPPDPKSVDLVDKGLTI